MSSTSSKLLTSIVIGAFIGALAGGIHWLLIGYDSEVERSVLTGDVVIAFVAASVCAALYLGTSRARFMQAASRITVVSSFSFELCHAVLPLCFAAYRLGPKEVVRVADRTINDLCAALSDASVTSFFGQRVS